MANATPEFAPFTFYSPNVIRVPGGKRMRSWIVAVGVGVLVFGIVMYLITVLAVPMVAPRTNYDQQFAQNGVLPLACAQGSQQQCSDALSLLALMRQVQPLALFVGGLGVVLLGLGIVLEPAGSRLKNPR